MLPENESLIRRTENLLRLVKTNYDKSLANLTEGDIRISFFGLTGNALHSLLLHYASVTTTLGEVGWWIKFYKRRPNAIDRSAINQLAIISKHAYFSFFFARIETIMRKTINLLHPSFDVNISKSFKKIYDEYLYKLSLDNLIPLFDITRLIRNTMHNNGTFVSRNGKNQTIIWKDKEYCFIHKKAIDFFTDDEFFNILEDLILSIEKITNSTFFSEIDFIEDKYH
jgi:hypothetical protein